MKCNRFNYLRQTQYYFGVFLPYFSIKTLSTSSQNWVIKMSFLSFQELIEPGHLQCGVIPWAPGKFSFWMIENSWFYIFWKCLTSRQNNGRIMLLFQPEYPRKLVSMIYWMWGISFVSPFHLKNVWFVFELVFDRNNYSTIVGWTNIDRIEITMRPRISNVHRHRQQQSMTNTHLLESACVVYVVNIYV